MRPPIPRIIEQPLRHDPPALPLAILNQQSALPPGSACCFFLRTAATFVAKVSAPLDPERALLHFVGPAHAHDEQVPNRAGAHRCVDNADRGMTSAHQRVGNTVVSPVRLSANANQLQGYPWRHQTECSRTGVLTRQLPMFPEEPQTELPLGDSALSSP